MALDPKVTILMPVYNAALHLGQALESMLAQSFSDFEFLIIDDASTDESAPLLAALRDERVRVVRNPVNLGVAGTLNTGLQLARGQYVARMDADDVSLPQRLERQVAYLDSHPEVSVVGVKVVLIDAEGHEAGTWREDQETTTVAQIRAALARHNCIAHPGVMMRRDVTLEFGYRAGLPYAQDYELWLRMTAAGCRIEKLDEVLLKYRVHGNSVTSQTGRANVLVKNIKIRRSFIFDRLVSGLPINRFVLEVLKGLLRDLFTVSAAGTKALFFAMARVSLLKTGMLLGALAPVRNRSGLFFFFPFFHVGGAERVHADIIATVSHRKPWICFTNRSNNRSFRFLFEGKGKLLELWPCVSNIVFKHLLTGFFASLINRHGRCVVFGGHSPFFYDLLPYLGEEVRRIDLLHAFGTGLEDVSLKHVAKISQRIVINRQTVEDLRVQYRQNGIPLSLLDSVRVIENKVNVPGVVPDKGKQRALQVLCVSRNSAEKRVHMVGSIARLSHENSLIADFTLVGDLLPAVCAGDRRFCRFTGEVSQPDELHAIYRDADAILITSSTEGFPMVVMEAMAHGVVPICTDVGGISVHIRHRVNGFLVPNAQGDEAIAASFLEILQQLQTDRQLLQKVSASAHAYCKSLFSGEAFQDNYRSLLDAANHSGPERDL